MLKKGNSKNDEQPLFILSVEKTVQTNSDLDYTNNSKTADTVNSKKRNYSLYNYLPDYVESSQTNSIIYAEDSIGLGNTPITLNENVSYNRDLRQERKEAINNIKVQKRSVRNNQNYNLQVGADYINKPQTGLHLSTIKSLNINSEYEIGKRKGKTPYKKPKRTMTK